MPDILRAGCIRLSLLLCLLLSCVARAAPTANEILWDRYGVPHIYATSTAAVFYGYGWAQAQSHADRILRLYGEARGRGAEYWGSDYESTTRWLLINGVPERARQWYRAQTPEFRSYLDAFARGINDYARAHPEAIDPAVRVVLPVDGIDVVAHAHRLMNFIYVASPGRGLGEGDPPELAEQGSNSWAVMPKKTANGHTLLLQNPHLAWDTDYYIYYEAHLVAPGFELYGATQIGLPVVRFAFNQRMGISNTVNSMLGATTYKLTLQGGGYLYDGKVRAFERRQLSYLLRQPDGSLARKPLEVRSTVHGPLIERKDGTPVALRVAGLDRPYMLQQYFDMVTAPSFDAYSKALSRLQVPTFNILYADREGHIDYLFNGVAPRRMEGDLAFWQGLVPGDSSRYLWTSTHPIEDLPRVTDPPGGFVQNTNDPPWLASWPATLKAQDYPPYLAPRAAASFRAQSSVKLMAEHDGLTLESFRDLKLSEYALMADRVLPELLPPALADVDPQVRAAAQLLAQWDRRFTAESRGALLFEEWARLFAGDNFAGLANYREPWSAAEPLSTPRGIKNPTAAVDMLRRAITETRRKYGAIDRPFGEVSRFALDEVDLPGNGGFGNLGAFRVITWTDPDAKGIRTPRHGETWVAVIEFATPVRAWGLMSYGNSRQRGTRHHADQLALLSRNEFRELWLQRSQIAANLEERTALSGAPH
ncbi:MAG TPA: penicillin acylase family protein [Steroidobacteraceae bacterium]|nr:penicillin acylase family protein [Steroidobacteraceae bacterium]